MRSSKFTYIDGRALAPSAIAGLTFSLALPVLGDAPALLPFSAIATAPASDTPRPP